MKNHIIKNTKCDSYKNKYIICKPFVDKDNERSIDFLLYIKYADKKLKQDELILINYLQKKYKIEIIKYGSHTKQSLLDIASKTKYIIYYSFFDTGVLSLIEMKIMGAWHISHLEEFIENGYGSYIKELDKNITSSLNKLNDIYKMIYNPELLSQNVVNSLNCVNSLSNLVNIIINSL